MSTVNVKRLKPAKVCIFCGAPKVTGEHIWPHWSAPLFDKGPSPNVTEQFQTNHHGQRLSSEVRKRQGHVAAKKIYAVCGPCNNGWMSRLEEVTKPHLLALSNAESVRLDANAQSAVTHWVTLKMMVGEHSRRDHHVFTQSHRTAFMERGIVPSPLQIWMFRCGGGVWRSSYMRITRAIEMVRATDVHRAADFGHGPPNAHSIAIGFNELFIYANFTVLPRLTLDLEAGVFGVRLWPPTGTALSWPPAMTLDAGAATGIAETLSRAKVAIPTTVMR
jgi:hypothetical protein